MSIESNRVSANGGGADASLPDRLREGIGRVRALTREANARVREASITARQRAAGGLEDAADRLERLAEQRGNGDGFPARAVQGAHRLAQGIDSAAGYLRQGSNGGVSGAVERQIRANPAPSLVAILASGFIFGRMLR